MNVPPTIVGVANAPVNTEKVVSAEFQKEGNKILHFSIDRDKHGMPNLKKYADTLKTIEKLHNERKVLSSSIV